MLKPELNGLMCLIIEPDNSSAQILAVKLLNGGFLSSHIHSCSTALEMLAHPEEHFDVVLVNTSRRTPDNENLPGEIKKVYGARPAPPVLAYQYVREKEQLTSLIKNGYSDCFARPIDADVLWEKIETAIDPTLEHRNRVFASQISEPCKVTLELEIISLNEVGVELLSPAPLKIGTIINIESDILTECGVEGEPCRISSRKEFTKQSDESAYKIVAKFISLEPKQRQSLRLKTEALAREKRNADKD